MAVETSDEGRAVLERRTKVVRVAIYAYIASWAFFSLAAIGEMAGIMDKSLDGTSMVTGVSGLVAFLALLGSYVVVGMWIYRAHANLRLAGYPGLEYTPGWAIGWYFIPFANLVKPLHAMRELWKASHGAADLQGEPASNPLNAWWACWIVSNIVSNIGTRLSDESNGAAQIGLGLETLGSLASIVAAWLLLNIVNRINEAQQTRLGVAEAFA